MNQKRVVLGLKLVLWMTCMVDSINKDTALRKSGKW